MDMMHMRRQLLVVGPINHIYVLCRGERCPIMEFIDGLDARTGDRVNALIERIAWHGLPRNREKYRRIKHHRLVPELALDEIKLGQVRILCFTDADGALVLTNGFIKKRASQLAREVERAIRMIEDYHE